MTPLLVAALLALASHASAQAVSSEVASSFVLSTLTVTGVPCLASLDAADAFKAGVAAALSSSLGAPGVPAGAVSLPLLPCTFAGGRRLLQAGGFNATYVAAVTAAQAAAAVAGSSPSLAVYTSSLAASGLAGATVTAATVPSAVAGAPPDLTRFLATVGQARTRSRAIGSLAYPATPTTPPRSLPPTRTTGRSPSA